MWQRRAHSMIVSQPITAISAQMFNLITKKALQNRCFNKLFFISVTFISWVS